MSRVPNVLKLEERCEMAWVLSVGYDLAGFVGMSGKKSDAGWLSGRNVAIG